MVKYVEILNKFIRLPVWPVGVPGSWGTLSKALSRSQNRCMWVRFFSRCRSSRIQTACCRIPWRNRTDSVWWCWCVAWRPSSDVRLADSWRSQSRRPCSSRWILQCWSTRPCGILSSDMMLLNMVVSSSIPRLSSISHASDGTSFGPGALVLFNFHRATTTSVLVIGGSGLSIGSAPVIAGCTNSMLLMYRNNSHHRLRILAGLRRS